MEYQDLAEKSPAGILVIRNDIIVYANPAFSDFSGFGNA